MGVQGLPGFFRRPQAVVAQHQLPTAGQGGQPALLGAVKGERHEQQLAAVAAHFVALGDGLAMHAQWLVSHRYALGFAG
ncbi:hypothetical protein D3C72_1829930 [compost metagenome]